MTTDKPIAMWAEHARARRKPNPFLFTLRAWTSMAGWREAYQLRYLEPLNANTMLDVGCGGGRPFLKTLSRSVWGIEPQPELAIQARDIYQAVNCQSFETFYTNARFDAVISSDVLGHLEAKTEFAKQCFHLLRPGGTTFHIAETTSEGNWIYKRARSYETLFQRNWIEAPDHWHLVSWRRYREVFKEAGFVDVRIIPIQSMIPECGLLRVLLKDVPNLPLWLRFLRWLDGLLGAHMVTREIASILLTPLSCFFNGSNHDAGLGVVIVGRKPA